MSLIGAQVGWRALLGVVLLSSLQGAVVGIIRMRMTGRAGPSSEKPEEPAQEKPEDEPETSGREPFTPAALARTVRTTLDRASPC